MFEVISSDYNIKKESNLNLDWYKFVPSFDYEKNIISA